ncbi:hypothetical protein [Antribacter gilvus]|uniref:hypothetical protein n=1 Tax=Antribacter gilvus TaxID=2304675 RepID=UPI0013DEA4EA|nr:hypothetical protein [Antribacter gilvus]
MITSVGTITVAMISVGLHVHDVDPARQREVHEERARQPGVEVGRSRAPAKLSR